MKRLAIALTLGLVLVTVLLAPPAEAWRRGFRRHRQGPGFGVGVAAGLATGFLFSPLVVPRPYYGPAYYYAPYVPPAYYSPPPYDVRSCSQVSTPGHWVRVPRDDGYGYTTYLDQWVPDAYQTVCR